MANVPLHREIGKAGGRFAIVGKRGCHVQESAGPGTRVVQCAQVIVEPGQQQSCLHQMYKLASQRRAGLLWLAEVT